MGKFIITKKSTGAYYFSYKADNGEIIIHSEDYATEAKCETGIKELTTNALNTNNYTRVKLPFGYYFQIKSSNGMVLATSRIYSIERSVDFEIKRLRNTLAHAPIEFESLEEIIENQNLDIKQKNDTLKKTSEEQSKGMLTIFNELRRDFSYEERLWLIFGFYVFLILFMIASSLVSLLSSLIAAYANIVLISVIVLILWSRFSLNNDDEHTPTIGEYVIALFVLFSTLFPVSYFIHEAYVSILGLNNTWTKIIVGDIGLRQIENIAPLTIILFTILWFSVHQYGRAKKLRIEQQNKQAMIHFMQAVIANDGKVSKENQTFPILAPFFANAIIHRPFSQENYEPQLPVDKLFQMAKDTKDIVK